MPQLRIQMPLRPVKTLLGPGFLALLALCAGPGALSATQSAADASKTEAELQAVKSEIERVTRQVSEEQVERDRLSRELRTAEVSVGKAREGLDSVRRGRAERASRRTTLAAERKARKPMWRRTGPRWPGSCAPPI